ncbi:MAG: hypothetical protein Q7J57_11270 [Gemmobacter sp.]|nr:hypothetical protein [Gemmobacter sp.]
MIKLSRLFRSDQTAQKTVAQADARYWRPDWAPSILLCGFEHGGTTLLSEVFRTNGYRSGFECGILYADTPSNFREHKQYFNQLARGWRVSSEVVNEAITKDFRGFYKVLLSSSLKALGNGLFFDKTPGYMSRLGRVLSTTDFIRRAVVIHRDPRAVFVSQASRIDKTLPVETVIENNFPELLNRYLRYFIGSISHIDDPDVLFVPFHGLVLDEAYWLPQIGHFADGRVFKPRVGQSKYSNVESTGMVSSKVTSFQERISPKMEKRILEATRLASPFFQDEGDRNSYGELWVKTLSQINTVLAKYELPRYGIRIESNQLPESPDQVSAPPASGIYFEPMTYLLRHPKILQAGVNPVAHFTSHGRNEGRNPA